MSAPSREPVEGTMPEELETADALLDQADALLHRHRGAASLMTASGDDLAADDLPLLTEIVDHPQPPTGPTEASPSPSPQVDLVERLVALDALISREVEAWLAEELTELLDAELARVAERVRSQALAQMRATLLPALSEHISATLNGKGPD